MKNFPRLSISIVCASALLICQAALIAAEPAAPPKGNFQWEKTRTPMALMIRGMWWEYFQVPEALDTVGFRNKDEFRELPLSYYSVIVMINASLNRLPSGGMEQIQEFVRQGGGLVVLGGLSAYGNASYHLSKPLIEMLPVDLKDSYIEFFPTAEKGAKLSAAPKADWPMNVDFPAGPSAYYFHTLIPTNGATVQVNVGNQPAFVSGTYGKGRVVACSLTVCGEPPSGSMPFWEWKDWPKLLGQACEWAAGARPAGEKIAKSKSSTLKPLTDEELRSAEMELNELPKDFVKRAVAYPDENTAKLLFSLAAPGNEEPKCGLDVVLPAILPYAKPEWAAKLKPLVEGMNPNIETRKAALILLGACRDATAYGPLLKALEDERTQFAAMDGLGRLGNEKAIPLLKSRFDKAIKSAQLPDGPDRFTPALFVTMSPVATYSAVALYRLGDPEGVTRLCTWARNLELYLNIFANSTKRWPRDPVGQAILAELQASTENLAQTWQYLLKNAGPVPASQREAFLKYATTIDDQVMIEFLVGAIEKSSGQFAKTDWQALANAKSGIIAKTGKALSAGE